MTAVRFQKMGGTRLIAEAQLLVLTWCRIVDIGAHHARWLLLQALFITASVPTVTSTAATSTMTKGLFISDLAPSAVHWSNFRGLKMNPQ